MAGEVTIAGSDTGAPAGQRVLGPLTVQGGATVGETVAGSLTSGDNTFAVPVGAIGVVIIPPLTGGTVTLKVRTSSNSGDAGLPISSTLPSVLVFPASAPTSVIVNSSGALAAFTSLWFW